jgi:hypothetical protein
MIKKIKLSIYLCIVLVCVGCKNNSNADKTISSISEDYEEDIKYENVTETQRIKETECFSTPEEIVALGLPEDMLAYWLVLNNKKAFVSMNEDGQKFYLNEYFWYLGNVEPEYHVTHFMIVDMDGDGLEEVVLECSPGASQVLHYEDGEVYSYQFGTRAMKRIHINGIYDASGGAASNYYFRLTNLNKDGYTEEMIAKMKDDYYEVEGEEVNSEEFFDYVNSIESVELAEHMEFTEDMLNTYLLGDLSEEELSIVKHVSTEETEELEINYSTDYNEGTDKSDENINFENPYFYSQTDCFYSADIQYIDVDTVTTINGELELQWLKEYNNGNLYKLMVEPDGNIIDYLGNERLIIYFYVTADKIYRLWSYVVQDGKLIEFYNNDILLIETLNTDEKLIENGELVCCTEDKTDESELSEVGKHVTIVQQGEQITYNRVDIGESGNREFYETFVWVKGNGLVEYKSGYRMEADILYIDNIFMKLGK